MKDDEHIPASWPAPYQSSLTVTEVAAGGAVLGTGFGWLIGLVLGEIYAVIAPLVGVVVGAIEIFQVMRCDMIQI